MEQNHKYRFFRAGRMKQARLETAEDILDLRNLDKKLWTVLAASVKGLRFDQRTLEFLDANKTGRVNQPEILAAVDYLVSKGVDLGALFKPDKADETRLAEVMALEGDLAKAKPSAEDRAALKAWEESPSKDAAILPLGDATGDADAALAAVEPVIEAWFAVPDEAPLVTEEPDKDLPLKDHLNPKHVEAMAAFAAKTVEPLLGARDRLTRLEWKGVKAKFAPYRAWLAAKPVMAADAKAKLEDEEKLLRYKLYLLEFLENYVNQRRLYDLKAGAMYQTGVLYLDGRAFELCFHVEDEGAHAALAEKSKCCLVYAKLVQKVTKQTRTICAVVTAGRVAPLYAGRNGLFFDREGNDWDAVVTKVVEAPVSLAEAFWAPWAKLFKTVSDMAKKFLADKETANAPKAEKPNPAMLASSVAAISVGVGMMGAACAGAIGVLAGLPPLKVAIGLVALVLVVSLPSVVLAYFKLRQRDLGAVLNACGWAVNRPLRFSMRLARTFTKKGRA